MVDIDVVEKHWSMLGIQHSHWFIDEAQTKYIHSNKLWSKLFCMYTGYLTLVRWIGRGRSPVCSVLILVKSASVCLIVGMKHRISNMYFKRIQMNTYDECN